jgi:hypothetical protein
MKRTWFQAQFKQDIAITTQNEHERHSTHKRGSYSIFIKRKPSTSIYIPKATKSIAIRLMSITRNVKTSSLAYHGDKAYERSTSLCHKLQMQSMKQRCKHDMIQEWKCNMHMYINRPSKAQKGKTTPSSLRKRANVAWSKGLVRIYASCFSVGTWMRSMFPFSTLSLRK